MPRQKQPPAPRPADLTAEQMRAAISRLERRLEELNALNPAEVQGRGDERFRTVELKIEDTLVSTFWNDTVEYSRYRVGSLDTAPIYMGGSTSLQEVREGYRRGKEKAATKLQTIIDIFKERLDELGESLGGRALRAIGELDLHPEIERAVSGLFRDGHYANAIENGCKALDALVKMRSGRDDLSGTELMSTVFSVKNPILRFNDGVSDSDKSEQQGMMHLYTGVMLAFRNPRAHEIIEDDPEKALEVLSFISFLAKTLDKATRKE